MTQTTLTMTPETTRCPRCGGHLYRDQYGDAACIACGWVAHRPPLPFVRAVPAGGAREGAGRPKLQPLRREIVAARAQITAYLRANPGATTTDVAKALGIERHAAESRLESMYTSHLVERAWRPTRLSPNRWSVKEEA